MVAKPHVERYKDSENQARGSRFGRDSTKLHARPADAHDGSAAGIGLSIFQQKRLAAMSYQDATEVKRLLQSPPESVGEFRSMDIE